MTIGRDTVRMQGWKEEPGIARRKTKWCGGKREQYNKHAWKGVAAFDVTCDLWMLSISRNSIKLSNWLSFSPVDVSHFPWNNSWTWMP